ncbi:MAG TPA: hypothetical protein VKU44_00755 [Terriglobia bacterium]|nr:hypothetical protein [Terriglobia bacterium]
MNGALLIGALIVARLVTLTTLENRVLRRANLEFSSNQAIIQSGELDDNINEGIAALYNLFSQVEGQPYYLESTSFTTSSSTDTYAIGTGQAINVGDFYKFRGLDVNFGTDIVITARPFMWSERNRFKWYPGWIYSQPVFYRMVGKASTVAASPNDAIKLIPQPSGQFTCTLWYTPTPPKLSSGSDTFDGVAGFEEFAVLDAAIKLLVKQEQMEHAQALGAMQAAKKDEILGMLANRDAENPERVQDVTLNDGWIGRPGY